MNPSSSRLAVLFALCLALGVGVAQPYVEDSIDVGRNWVPSLCYNPSANVIYGTSGQPGNFFTIDCVTNRVVSVIDGINPYCVAYSRTSNKAYCTVSYGMSDSVLVVDGFTHQRVKSLPLYNACYLAWDSVSDRMLVSQGEENQVSVIDCRTDSVISIIPVAGGPLRLGLNTNRHKGYVLNDDVPSVSILDLDRNQVVRTYPTGESPEAGCYCGAADKFYCHAIQGVRVIDGVTDSMLGIIPMRYWNISCMQSIDRHGLVAVAVYRSLPADTVYFIDTESDSFIRRLPVGDGPTVMLWNSRTDVIYVGNAWSRTVTALSGDGLEMLGEVAVAEYPASMALPSSSRRLYVGHFNSRRVYVIRDSSEGVVEQGAPAAREPRLGAILVRKTITLAGSEPMALVGITGREAALLKPGRNDLRSLPPGVYVVVAPGEAERRKIVLTAGD